MSYRFADSLRAGSGQNQLASRIRNEPACEQDQDGTSLRAGSGRNQLASRIRNEAACEQDQDRTRLRAGSGRNQLASRIRTELQFYSKNKFEKLMHLVGFIIRIYRDAQSPER